MSKARPMSPERIGEFINEYTRQVTSNYNIKAGVDKIEHCAMGISGEGGEVVDVVKKSHYTRSEGLNRVELIAEAGDVVWYLTNLADQLGMTLMDLMLANVEKLRTRHGGEAYSPEALHELMWNDAPDPDWEHERDPQSPGTSFRP